MVCHDALRFVTEFQQVNLSAKILLYEAPDE